MASHCRRSSRQVPPNLCRRTAARPHADRPDAHAADGRFSSPWAGMMTFGPISRGGYPSCCGACFDGWNPGRVPPKYGRGVT